MWHASLPPVFRILALVPGVAATAHVADARAQSRPSSTIEARLSEWEVDLSRASAPAGTVVFSIMNAGTIPHAFEVEGEGIERETGLIQPGQKSTLTLTLGAGRYEIYCPVGSDSHRKLGMVAHLDVAGSGPVRTAAASTGERSQGGTKATALEVTGGGAVIQILPGPFPFADSAAAVIRARPTDQQADLQRKAAEGPYSNRVARIDGRMRVRAWDLGATRDSVAGTAEFTTQDGARWKVVMDRVQTKDIPFNPRFGGVIMGLYYHGSSGVHTPLVPTIRSALALWAFAHLYRNDMLVTDSAMVHAMLLSRTRQDGDFALACWDCSTKPIVELQLQVTTGGSGPKLDAPGGFLFVNWEHSESRPL